MITGLALEQEDKNCICYSYASDPISETISGSLNSSGSVLHRMIIRKYSLCFIPDLPGEMNLSGRLSHGIKLPGNVRYIGILSRFPDTDTASARESGAD